MRVATEEQLQDQLADGGGERTDIFGKAVSEVGLASPLHEIVAHVVTEENEKDGCHVVEALDVP